MRSHATEEMAEDAVRTLKAIIELLKIQTSTEKTLRSGLRRQSVASGYPKV